MNSLEELFTNYGCSVNNFTDINTLSLLINKFNKFNKILNIKYVSCKDDAGVFVLVTNKYVIKLYSDQRYSIITNIYHRLLAGGYQFNNIEKIYYYYSVKDGKVIHDTYSIIPNHDDINSTINELLIPIFRIEMGNIISNIIWDGDMVKKFLVDISNALFVLHTNNIIHGDATPDNVGFRYSDNNFVLFDFGNSIININNTIPDLYKNDMYLNDINRFLNSILGTYKQFFKDYLIKINIVKNLVNEGPYIPDKFKNVIENVFI